MQYSEISMAEEKGIGSPASHSGIKSPNSPIKGAMKEDSLIHSDKSHHHHKETHGTSDDIDENTPIDEVKGPSVFQRVKEEVEAMVDAVHPKK